jgi:hypothetical protein
VALGAQHGALDVGLVMMLVVVVVVVVVCLWWLQC